MHTPPLLLMIRQFLKHHTLLFLFEMLPPPNLELLLFPKINQLLYLILIQIALNVVSLLIKSNHLIT